MRYPALDDGDFVFSRQVNLETIHTHDVLAERYGTIGELRLELEQGGPLEHHTELREWLAGAWCLTRRGRFSAAAERGFRSPRAGARGSGDAEGAPRRLQRS